MASGWGSIAIGSGAAKGGGAAMGSGGGISMGSGAATGDGAAGRSAMITPLVVVPLSHGLPRNNNTPGRVQTK